MGRLWEKSNSIEFDNNGERAGGAIANFFVGGTTTPLTTYSNAAESTPHLVDVTADANGRWPNVFIPFTASYDVQGRTSGGTQLFYPRSVPNPDPVEASEDSVDDEQLIQTGHVWAELVDETKVGAARLNGRTIGNASSGATERANADTEDLFTYLWNKLANDQAAVSTGRGASAAADYAANKTITLPDLRGGVLVGLDDMGNSAASRLGSAPFTNGDATTPGSILGANTHTLATTEIPSHLHAISLTTSSGGSHSHSTTSNGDHTHTATVTDPGHTHTPRANSGSAGTSNPEGAVNGNNAGGQYSASPNANMLATTSNTTGITVSNSTTGAHTHTTDTHTGHTHTVSGNSANTGGGGAHNNVSYGALVTWYIKL